MTSHFAPAPPQGEAPESVNQPIRFTLRELCILVVLVSLTCAAFTWVHAGGILALLLALAGVCASLGFAIHVLTRWSFDTVFAISSLLFLVLLCLVPPFHDARISDRRMSCSNNLHNIVLALQQYETHFGCYPPAYIADAQGKPMHSWRVLLLPYLEQKTLYDQYRFDEPWDGPNNSKLHSLCPRLYRCRSDSGLDTDTSYFAIVGPQTIWPGETTIRAADIVDPSKTILLAEVANSGIHWMEPRDLDASQMAMLINAATSPGISSGHPSGAYVAHANGSVSFLTNDASPSTLRAALARNGKGVPLPP